MNKFATGSNKLTLEQAVEVFEKPPAVTMNEDKTFPVNKGIDSSIGLNVPIGTVYRGSMFNIYKHGHGILIYPDGTKKSVVHVYDKLVYSSWTNIFDAYNRVQQIN